MRGIALPGVARTFHCGFTLTQNSADAGSILADNIAGLLFDKLKKKELKRGWQIASAHGGMDWEIWTAKTQT
jgi:hypothetical protein